MTVRELIESLLDYDMDHEVKIGLNTDGETEWKDFEFDDIQSINEVYLMVDLSGFYLVETDRLEELEEAEEKLEQLEG